MTLELINPEGLSSPLSYTHVVAATGSRLVLVAGQVADDADGNLVGDDDLAAQAHQAFANVGRALAAVGARFGRWPMGTENRYGPGTVRFKGVQGMKRFLLVIALALGLLVASALPAIADEHVAKQSKWSHDRTKVYTTTAVNQHNQYGDLQGILKFRQASALNTGYFDIQIDYVRLYRVLPDRSGLLVVGDNTGQNLLVTETWTYVNSGWQACGPNLPTGWYYAVSRFQLIHKHTVGADDFSGWRFVRTAKWHYDGRCF